MDNSPTALFDELGRRVDGIHLLVEDRGDGRLRVKDGALKERLLLLCVEAELRRKMSMDVRVKGFDGVEIALNYAHAFDDIGSIDLIPAVPPPEYFEGMREGMEKETDSEAA